MKSKILIAATALFAMACGPVEHASMVNLPPSMSQGAPYAQRGAILLDEARPFGKRMVGELLHVDGEALTIVDPLGHVRTVPRKVTGEWKLYTHKPSVTTYGWSAPTSIGLFFIHGFYGMLTIPVTWLVDLGTASAERHAYGVPMNEIPLEKLRAYARYPVVIPDDFVPVGRSY